MAYAGSTYAGEPYAAPRATDTSGTFDGLYATLPALTAELDGLAQVIVATDTTWGNDGYTYTGDTGLDYSPPVAAPPPGAVRQDVRRVHQSLPTPTLVKGRPQ